MSDTDDGFDEEAVRRELREKYEDDDREETERMSELLLQGATMTNQHCDHCGTPIFRYDGQAFCPNCQHAAGQADQQRQTGQQSQSQGTEQAQSGEQPQTGEQPQPSEHAQTGPPAADEDVQAAEERHRGRQPQADGQTVEESRAQPQPGQRRTRDQQPRRGQLQSGAPSSEAADALESSISALARRAAGCDDPRRAREYLEAAREAAEALAALRHNA